MCVCMCVCVVLWKQAAYHFTPTSWNSVSDVAEWCGRRFSSGCHRHSERWVLFSFFSPRRCSLPERGAGKIGRLFILVAAAFLATVWFSRSAGHFTLTQPFVFAWGLLYIAGFLLILRKNKRMSMLLQCDISLNHLHFCKEITLTFARVIALFLQYTYVCSYAAMFHLSYFSLLVFLHLSFACLRFVIIIFM